MKISVIHPSRSRPEMAFSTATKWIKRAGMEVEYTISVDSTDPLIRSYTDLFVPVVDRFELNNNKSAIEAINVGAEMCNGDLLVVVSDDFSEPPLNWAIDLLSALPFDESTDYLIKTDDGIQPTLVTLPILGRDYYNRFGYVYEPGYQHMFCDQEMTAVAIMTGKYVKIPLKIPHLHYIVGGMKRDAINDKNNATWDQGQSLFNERLKSNFGLKDEEIIKHYSEIKWK